MNILLITVDAVVESCNQCPFASDNGRYGDHARCAALPEGKDDICLASWAKFRRHDCPLRPEDIPDNRTASEIVQDLSSYLESME